MGAIAKRMVWAMEKAGLKVYLRISHDADDGLLKVLLTVAVELAEQYVGENLDYLDPVGGTPLPLPEPVRLWVYRYAAWRYERRDERSAESIGRGGDSIDWKDEPDYALLAQWRTVYL